MGLEELRAEIDRVDDRIVDLLGQRAELVREVGSLKQTTNAHVYAPDREEQIFQRLAALNAGPLTNEALRAIYVEVISACRALERPMRVAFLGPEGTFTHQAVKRHFGRSTDCHPTHSIWDVFLEVERGRTDHGVVPIENSTEGSVGETLNALMEFDLKVCGEIQMRIHHSLMAADKDAPIEKIYSKQVVFGQCRRWLAEHYPTAAQLDAGSTSRAAKLAAAEPGAAAIAHRDAAAIYDLQVLHANIEDSTFNATRFFVLGKGCGRPTGRDKTSVLCFIKDEVGALLHILNHFSRAGINLTKIESWPSRRRVWDYCFFIDFEGHADGEKEGAALAEVGRSCNELKLLGSYPKASEAEKG